jgi:hypothetical protein
MSGDIGGPSEAFSADRPGHWHLIELEQILGRQDRLAGTDGEHFVEVVESYVDWDAVVYVAHRRVDRTLEARGAGDVDPLLTPMFASMWIDGFLAGAEYGKAL